MTDVIETMLGWIVTIVSIFMVVFYPIAFFYGVGTGGFF